MKRKVYKYLILVYIDICTCKFIKLRHSHPPGVYGELRMVYRILPSYVFIKLRQSHPPSGIRRAYKNINEEEGIQISDLGIHRYMYLYIHKPGGIRRAENGKQNIVFIYT